MLPIPFMNPMAALMQGSAQDPLMSNTPVQDPMEAPPVATVEGSLGGYPDEYRMSNNRQIMEADEANAEAEEMAERKGMFGVKGTLRDILGILGDSFLVQSGNDPMYGPRREQEMLSDAMTGYTAQPLEAIERVARINPNAAMELAERYGVDLNNQMAHRRGMIGHQLDAEKEAADRYKTGMTLFGQLYGSINDDRTLQAMTPAMNRIKEIFGLGDEFQVGDKYDPELARAYAEGSMPTSRQVTARQADRRLDQGDRRLDQGDRRVAQGDARVQQGAARVQQGDRRTTVAEQREARQAGEGGRGSRASSSVGTTPGAYQLPNGGMAVRGFDGSVTNMTREQARDWVAKNEARLRQVQQR